MLVFFTKNFMRPEAASSNPWAAGRSSKTSPTASNAVEVLAEDLLYTALHLYVQPDPFVAGFLKPVSA